jgi:hypothetical protein
MLHRDALPLEAVYKTANKSEGGHLVDNSSTRTEAVDFKRGLLVAKAGDSVVGERLQGVEVEVLEVDTLVEDGQQGPLSDAAHLSQVEPPQLGTPVYNEVQELRSCRVVRGPLMSLGHLSFSLPPH